jgi:putative endonuclease
MKHYVYIVECSDGSLYTGFTLDVEKRVSDHNLGKGAKSIKGKRPVRLVYSESFETKSEALKREIQIKTWPRARKQKLISEIMRA